MQKSYIAECRLCGLRVRVPMRATVCAQCCRDVVSAWAEAANSDPEAAKACGYPEPK